MRICSKYAVFRFIFDCFFRRLTAINKEYIITNDKPYDVCLTCPYIGKTCDGPNFLAMSTERWSEWARTRKDLLNITNSQLADESEIPKGTIDRVLSGHGGDVRLSTMRAITKQLVGGTWGQYPCHSVQVMKEEVTAETTQELEQLREYVNTSKDDHAREISHLVGQNEDAKSTIKEKNKRITVLTTALIILAAAVIAVLLYDVLNPNVGFVRY